MSTTEENAKKAAGFLSGILTGWGVPANWARIITGAIIGAVAAAVTLTATSCSCNYTATDGQKHTGFSASFAPDFGLLENAAALISPQTPTNTPTK